MIFVIALVLGFCLTRPSLVKTSNCLLQDRNHSYIFYGSEPKLPLVWQIVKLSKEKLSGLPISHSLSCIHVFVLHQDCNFLSPREQFSVSSATETRQAGSAWNLFATALKLAEQTDKNFDSWPLEWRKHGGHPSRTQEPFWIKDLISVCWKWGQLDEEIRAMGVPNFFAVWPPLNMIFNPLKNHSPHNTHCKISVPGIPQPRQHWSLSDSTQNEGMTHNRFRSSHAKDSFIGERWCSAERRWRTELLERWKKSTPFCEGNSHEDLRRKRKLACAPVSMAN